MSEILKRKNKKRKVFFDTSFLSRVKEGKIELEKEFPVREYERLVSDTF